MSCGISVSRTRAVAPVIGSDGEGVASSMAVTALLDAVVMRPVRSLGLSPAVVVVPVTAIAWALPS